ncbi:MAG: murein biosynthesis integral membrane protein MurJ [Gaiellales bacterium]
MATNEDAPIQGARSRSVSAALFSVATGISRVLGLVREVISAQLLGVSGPASAFVVANNVPNTVRSLVADSALGASFVPVFNELLVKGERERAWRVASSALTLATLALMGITALGILLARPLLGLANLSGEQLDLAVQMTRILFPILILLGISGLVQAILNSFDEFVLPAIAPVFWNLVIIAFLVYAFTVHDLEQRALILAVGTLAGTVVQTLIPLPGLRGKGGRLRPVIDVRDPAVRRILILLIPVALGLGLANVNLTVSTYIATYVDPRYAPRAIDAAFRVYMLPQGIFSVAVSTVMFPSLARAVAARDFTRFRGSLADGTRLIVFMLLPASAVIAVLAEPIVQLLFQRGAWTPSQTPGVADALIAFSLGLALNGVILLLTRCFFALQHVWVATAIALVNLVVAAGLSLLLYGPCGVWGIPLANSLANVVVVPLMWVLLSKHVGDLDNAGVLRSALRSLLLAVGVAALAWVAWDLLRAALGTTLPAQLVEVGVAIALAVAAYLGAMRLLHVPEATRIIGLVRRGSAETA